LGKFSSRSLSFFFPFPPCRWILFFFFNTLFCASPGMSDPPPYFFFALVKLFQISNGLVFFSPLLPLFVSTLVCVPLFEPQSLYLSLTPFVCSIFPLFRLFAIFPFFPVFFPFLSGLFPSPSLSPQKECPQGSFLNRSVLSASLTLEISGLVSSFPFSRKPQVPPGLPFVDLETPRSFDPVFSCLSRHSSIWTLIFFPFQGPCLLVFRSQFQRTPPFFFCSFSFFCPALEIFPSARLARLEVYLSRESLLLSFPIGIFMLAVTFFFFLGLATFTSFFSGGHVGLSRPFFGSSSPHVFPPRSSRLPPCNPGSVRPFLPPVSLSDSCDFSCTEVRLMTALVVYESTPRVASFFRAFPGS